MAEPRLFGDPITLVFLFFITYSFLGWAMETAYCSVLERKLTVRGFLLGPICPIYGVGALMMVYFFSQFTDNLAVFYVVSTLSMSAWEYFVGWLLETTTHMKYWDYSSHRFHLQGRISLFICLWWGVLAYGAVFWIHPAVVGWFAPLPLWVRCTLAGLLLGLVTADSVFTIRNLAITVKLLDKLERVNGELQLQAALARAELADKLEETHPDLAARLEELSDIITSPEALRARLAAARDALPESRAEAEALLRARRAELLARAERSSNRFRARYRNLSSRRYRSSMEEMQAVSSRLRELFGDRRKGK